MGEIELEVTRLPIGLTPNNGSVRPILAEMCQGFFYHSEVATMFLRRRLACSFDWR
jgi:hypothetical protein